MRLPILVSLCLALPAAGSAPSLRGPQGQTPRGWETIDNFKGIAVREYRELHEGTDRISVIGTRTERGEAHGPEWTFWPNGTPRIKRVWARGALEGLYQAWFKSGRLRIEGHYLADGRVGKWRRLTEAGTVITASEYKDGQLHGAFREYYVNGNPKSERQFSGGLQTGLETRWGKGGAVELEGHWLAGKRHGPWKEVRRKLGSSRFEGHFEHDLREGPWIERSMSGAKVAEGMYVKGQLEGERTTWRTDGSLSTRASYEGGKETGPFVAWHKNGQKQMEGRKVDGRRTGPWTYWTIAGEVDERYTGNYADDVRVEESSQGESGALTPDGLQLRGPRSDHQAQ